jgi:hypothetical protein
LGFCLLLLADFIDCCQEGVSLGFVVKRDSLELEERLFGGEVVYSMKEILFFFFKAISEDAVGLNESNGTLRGRVFAFLALFWEASDLHFLNFSKALIESSSNFLISLFLSFRLVTRLTYSMSISEGTVP